MIIHEQKPLRVHLTNSKDHRWNKLHKICYCGGSYDTFGGDYRHSVYTLYALRSDIAPAIREKLCPDCMDNPDLAIDLLNGLDEQ